MSHISRKICASFLLLAGVLFAVQMIDARARHSNFSVGEADFEFSELRHGNSSHDPGIGHHGDICSMAACVLIALTPSGFGNRCSDLPKCIGFSLGGSIPQGVNLARDPPVPRLKTS